MHKFSISSGKELWYDIKNNRISSWNENLQEITYPVALFKMPSSFNPNKISMFTIEITQQCNLRCTYCCFSGNYRDRREHNENKITFETLSHVADFIIEHHDESASEITVCFYGGEALLAKREIRWLIDRLDITIGDKVEYSLSTNGLILFEKVIDWICKHPKFFVNVTIDGNKAMHDKNRKTIKGFGSYDAIIRNLSIFRNKYPVEYKKRVRFLATVYSWDDVLELANVWDNEPVLAGNYPVHISHIIPNFLDTQRVYDTWEIKNNFYSKAFEAYKNGQNGILYDCFQRLINIISRRNYQELQSNLEIKTCYQDLYSCFINTNGQVYACEKFCNEFIIGNTVTGFDKEAIQRQTEFFTSRKNKLCNSCWALRLCRMCMTSMNYSDEELVHMCNMERDTIDLALRYFCEVKDWENKTNK